MRIPKDGRDIYEKEKPYRTEFKDIEKELYTDNELKQSGQNQFNEELYETGELPENRPDGNADDSLLETGHAVHLKKRFPLDSAETFSGALADRIKLLEKAMEELTSAINERIRIGEEASSSLTVEIARLEFLLKEIRGMQINAHADIKRLNLERLITDLKREARMNRLSMWRDLISLKSELRELTAEHRSLLVLRELWEI